MRPVADRVVAVASFTASSSTSAAGKLVSRAAERRHEVGPLPLRNAMRARSRSTTSRTATLCTRRTTAPPADLAPEHRRNLVADEAVEHSPALLGLDQLQVEVAGL